MRASLRLAVLGWLDFQDFMPEPHFPFQLMACKWDVSPAKTILSSLIPRYRGSMRS
jgi:hypothetical protein